MSSPRTTRTVLLCSLALILTAVLSGCGSDDGEDVLIIGQQDEVLTLITCSIDDFPTGVFGTHLVEYGLFDFPGSIAAVVVEFSTDEGVTWTLATSGNGGEGTVGLSALPLGETHTFAWDTVTDLPGSVEQVIAGVLFRISPLEQSSGNFTGARCFSNSFNVDNLPLILDVSSLDSGLARVADPVGINLHNAEPFTGPMHVTTEIEFDSTVVTLNDVVAGPAASAGSTVTWQLLTNDRLSITLDSAGASFPDGEIITLLFDTICQTLNPLPDVSEVRCISVDASDADENPLGARCGSDGMITLRDNHSTLSVPDSLLTVGQATAPIPLNYATGTPGNLAEQASFTITYDPMLLDVSGVDPGPDLDPGATITFTPGSGSATVDIANPFGIPFGDGMLAFLQVDVLATVPAATTLDLGNLMVASETCAGVDAEFASASVSIDIGPLRTLEALRAVDVLGATGTPQLLPGTAVPGNPRGDYGPLNEGEFNDTIRLASGGNPIIFTSVGGAGFPIVLEAQWNVAPLTSDVAASMTSTGETVYMTLAGSGFVNISPDGVLTPASGNGCTTFGATFTPNGVTAAGMPMTVQFAACVDLGGIDGATRAVSLPVGNLDADIPGMPLGDILTGAGGSLTETIYVNTGIDPIGAYQVTSAWDENVLELDMTFGMEGYVQPSQVFLGGPTLVNTVTPGSGIASHFTVSTMFFGIFDIWTMHFNVLSGGSTILQHQLDSLASSAVPPVAIGAPTPRLSAEASTTTLELP